MFEFLTSVVAGVTGSANSADADSTAGAGAGPGTDQDGDDHDPEAWRERATVGSVVESIMDGMGYPIFIVDDEGYFTKLNEEGRELFDREPGNCTGTASSTTTRRTTP